MAVNTFAYIILLVLSLLMAYALAVSTNEPPVELYEPDEKDDQSADSVTTS
jgi:hypothetical protein